jgi:hypothetical protein
MTNHFLLKFAHPSDLLQGSLSDPRRCPKVLSYRMRALVI